MGGPSRSLVQAHIGHAHGFAVSVGSASEWSSYLAWCADGHQPFQHSEEGGKRPAWVTLQDLVSKNQRNKTKQKPVHKTETTTIKQNQFQSDEIITSVSNTCKNFFVFIP